MTNIDTSTLLAAHQERLGAVTAARESVTTCERAVSIARTLAEEARAVVKSFENNEAPTGRATLAKAEALTAKNARILSRSERTLAKARTFLESAESAVAEFIRKNPGPNYPFPQSRK